MDKATKLSGDRKKQVSLLVIVPLVSLIGYMSAKAYKDVSIVSWSFLYAFSVLFR